MNKQEEIYSGVDDDGIEIMLRKLDETSWIVDVRKTFEETDEYIDGYEYENYSKALNQYNKLNADLERDNLRAILDSM
tara:strand:+ start:57 stop:290 length:234 start_codon:yes stop_codon:yes gene_type:complete